MFVSCRLKQLEVLAEKFNRKAESIETWVGGKPPVLQRNDDIEEADLAGIQVNSCTGKIIR
jgi:ppGpp synthetase/RelA/SpoT-type nucleotidyltranferase